MQELFRSEAFWLTAASLATWLAQAVLTPLVGKIAPTSPWRKALRLAHGILDAVDPENKS